MKRRAFLQKLGISIGALGLTEAGFSRVVQQYGAALAEPTNRKLALLVGIDQYKDKPLRGCLTDLELQRELLVHRFGFRQQDVLLLTNQQATRQAIADAYRSHLVQQAQTGDVVLFHFSGYGGTVATPDQPQLSLVTADEPIASDEGLLVSDLLLETLSLLGRSLSTNQLTTVLDTCYTYSGNSLMGNLRVRARPTRAPAQISTTELVLRDQLKRSFLTGAQRPTPKPNQSEPDFPGMLLLATHADRLAAEAQWDGFSAGLFTLALTQALWQTSTPTTMRFVMGGVGEQIEHFTSQEQQPQVVTQPAQKLPKSPVTPYYLTPVAAGGADAIVSSIDETGKTARLWLGGIPTPVLEQYGVDSVLTVKESATPVRLRITARDGLIADAKVLTTQADSLKVGQFVREQVRLVSRNIGLNIALDSSLERHERVDAVSALSAISRVSIATAGEDSVDYLFRKISQPAQVAATNLTNVAPSIATQTSYGLFSPAQEAIPNTAGEGGEAVKIAIRRLAPKLQALLAAKLISLTENQVASGVAVKASLDLLTDKGSTTVQRRETGENIPGPTVLPEPGELPTLPIGASIQYRIDNLGDVPLYYLVVMLSSTGNLILPLQINDVSLAETIQTTAIAPKATINLPDSTAQWMVNKPGGFAETYVLCSRTPFEQALTLLKAANNGTQMTPLPNPLEVAQAILTDLHRASDSSLQTAAIASNNFALEVATWAGLRFLYQVV
ncbi:MAG TPA: caspase family protein [Leptolyngbyaceae cyanobacterium M33_DOE_097]|uniref:Caspase family protein n=1 Tax=Oscillatoriales cyanobacterium SpSt-418 TaxID=2282169 RepID=A0A7C3PGJ2_9CYAN|nr:caspase family protein [Leptolyngbyaceae cyanobacterium M33_DOE_097]